ncbi:MAG TPA: DUF397 domain-containing protein [Pseudonocardiaceae bacterium]
MTTWRKSSYSGPRGGECVEVGASHSMAVLVRDTKNRTGGTLAFGPDAWQRFAVSVKDTSKA